MRVLIPLFALGWIIIYSDRTTLYPVLPVIQESLHLTSTQAGAIASTYFLMYVAMQIPAGFLGDRIGLKRVLVVMYSLAGLAVLAVGLLASSYPLLLLFIALHGIGAGAYFPSAYGMLMKTVPVGVRGLSTGIVTAGQPIGSTIGLALSGPLYLLAGDWRFPFLFLSLPTLLLAFLCALSLREVPLESGAPRGFRPILRNRNIMALNLVSFCSLYGFWVVFTWGPTFFKTQRGLSLEVAGLYTAIISLAAIPSSLFLGRLSDRLGRKRLALTLLPLSALTILALAQVQSIPVLVLVLILYGLVGPLAMGSVSISWAGDHALKIGPQATATTMGVYNTAAMSSSFVAPLVSGWLRDVTGSLEDALYLGAALVFVAALLALIPQETAGKRYSTTQTGEA